MTYKALVIGLGQIGMGYDINAEPSVRVATLARAFSLHSEYELAGGVDTDNVRRELFQAKYKLPAFADVEAAINQTKPDIIAIAVPTNAHYQVFSEVMRLGRFKAILCEKPLSYDLAEAAEMVRLAAESGISLFTNYMRRCDSAVTEVSRRIACNEVIGPIKGICWYSKGLFNNGSHFLNLFQYWLGDVIDFQVIDSGRLWEGHDPEPDVKIKFKLGEVYFHAAQEENFSYHSVELIAKNGRLRYERGSMIWQASISDNDNEGYVILNSEAEFIKSDTARIQWAVVDQMARHLAGGDTSICTGLQGLSTVKVLTQIKKEL